ncbi:MAG TPA: type II toxin-antitoxin system VapC family toxin [Vicinamibacterales bacterium]|nr:type II toxin-antitoxin system VapC family toxin [Vicinamibacterales bacterium]
MKEAPVLDTHVWVWWMLGDERLDRRIARKLDALSENRRPVISGISLWEVAMLVNLGRLQLEPPLDTWLALATDPKTVTVWPVTRHIAALIATMPASFTRDPADRLIVATSINRQLPLLTYDQRIIDSGLVRLWKVR